MSDRTVPERGGSQAESDRDTNCFQQAARELEPTEPTFSEIALRAQELKKECQRGK